MSNALIVLIGPSGVGKSTVLHRFLKENTSVSYIPSYTTRPPRADDRPNHYVYCSKEVFEQSIQAGEFLEWAKVHNSYLYGTKKAEIETSLGIAIKEMDIAGVKQALSQTDVVLRTIFILPESLDILRKRITSRSTMSAEELERRLRSAKEEIEFASNADAVIVSREGEEDAVYRDFLQAIQDVSSSVV